MPPLFTQAFVMAYKVTDMDIQAYVDGELDEPEKNRVGDFISKNSWARARYFKLKAQNEALKKWWMSRLH